MIAALIIYAITSAAMTVLAVCFFIAGARSDEQQRQSQGSAEGAGSNGFHTHFDTRKGA